MEPSEQAQVYIIDDDRHVRDTLDAVLRVHGYQVQQFASAIHFLASCDRNRVACILADVRMPGMDGLELQEEIVRRRIPTSTIIITGHADVKLAVRAMKAGAFDLLEKPFDNQSLLKLLPLALAAAKEKLQRIQTMERARDLLAGLSPRERQVAELVSDGLPNKLIADRLSLSTRTVELHRAHVMDKLGVATVASLMNLFFDARAETTAPGPSTANT
jgi:FixJ family two-component response regulator